MSSSLLKAVTSYIEAQGGGQGLFPTQISSVNIMRSFQRRLPLQQIYRPSICVVIQGAKQILIGEEMVQYGAMECLTIGMELPATGRIVEAGPDSPYMGVTIEFDLAIMRDVLENLETPPTLPPDSGRCVFVSKVDGPLADCVLRIIRMNEAPQAIPILYPSVMREICYWLLSSPHGGKLCRLVLPETNTARISRAIHLIRTDLARMLRVEQLAEAARMSLSSFHQHFKALTSMTPLQFQKQLRLIEARRLMVTENASVTEAAYQVGYESASQFSREYSRMFGAPPKRDAMTKQRLYSQYINRKAQNAYSS
ncbi:AraC family transcriptional regulator [Bradyrhizobium sp. R2.2-H]|uniref:AraC family transcriptional regulator n=1 Tax=unclassified Bradyrhizobium TaxID=2631580 RepID=UPI001052F07C|nr:MULTISPECIES: AraC family transcriptional regulator [unclassified Bradyrhizobium]TCU69362.1 AraC family transcriptional regulator [Bradyrhizobium sp. Y-H1]TCU70854.1 AraC family transcriptional regulator [Bradyrhizobium sp. R2.2-H]